jgi:hypothetical protein
MKQSMEQRLENGKLKLLRWREGGWLACAHVRVSSLFFNIIGTAENVWPMAVVGGKQPAECEWK